MARIIYLHQYFNTPDMRGGTRSYELGRRLVEKGHTVDIVTTDKSLDSQPRNVWRVTEEAGMQVHWTSVPYSASFGFLNRLKAFFTFAMRARKRCRDLEADVVFATSTPLTIALPGVSAAKKLNVPLVFEVRDLWPDVPVAIGALKNPLLRKTAYWLENHAYKNATRIVALAPGMGIEIHKKGVPKENIVVIPNGCDLELFKPDRDKANTVRKKHSWLGDRKMLLYMGAFGKVNGLSWLVEMAKKLENIDPSICIVAIGAGPEWEKTRSLASERGILDKNIFILPSCSKSELIAWTAATDMTIALFTGPPIVWKDAVQNKFFDSLAAGKPVFCNFNGWQTIVAAENGAGSYLEPFDLQGAAEKVAHRMNDDLWLKQASIHARRLGEEHFSRDLQAKKLNETLLQAIEIFPG